MLLPILMSLKSPCNDLNVYTNTSVSPKGAGTPQKNIFYIRLYIIITYYCFIINILQLWSMIMFLSNLIIMLDR